MNAITTLTIPATRRTGRITTRLNRRPRPRTSNRPALRFTPYAWAKLLFLRDAGPTEVGGFGVSAEADPLLVEDLRLVHQDCTAVSVRFDDAAVADHFDDGVDAGLPPDRFARVWLHTHPDGCPRPSGTDERTFARVFGGCDWAVMAVLARGGAAYARLRFAAGPGGDLVLPVAVDFAAPFAAAEPEAWAAEYDRCVTDESASAFGPADTAPAGRRRDLALAGPGADAFDRFDRFDFDPFLSDTPDWEFHDERDRDEYGRNDGVGRPVRAAGGAGPA